MSADSAGTTPRLLLGFTVPDHVRWSAFGRAIDVSCLVDACKLNGSAKRFLVPALGDATEAIDWLKEHAHGAEVVEYRSEPVEGHPSQRTLTLPIDWCEQLREAHKHELAGSDKIRAISQAISIISNWLQSAGDQAYTESEVQS